eukprot:TRINITY_DN405_c0_g1_i1.p1 TRINITY_DN405_c0_g1~~TRINITY_DN405_c0_g1_i1.p1  ORF type:complete len:214 (+),score=36.33 TRINITY_DN405_c0_g1_i1:82-723(+)
MRKGIVFGIILVVFLAVWSVMDANRHRFFLFDPDRLHAIAKRNIDKKLPTRQLVRAIAEDLNKEYPGHINMEEHWMFNNAAGAMGAMYILHASITEYIIIFGTPIGTEGHSGRHLSDDYFIILEGEQWAYNAGDLEKTVYKPGEMHLLKRGDAQGYKIPERAWALEYARGWIPSMLPMGLADTLSSTMDFIPFFDTVRVMTIGIYNNLLLGKI